MADPISAAIGVGGSLLGSGIAYKGQRDATQAQKIADERQFYFEQQKYDDWQATYGPVQDNLASYYGSLTPEYYEAQGLEAFQQEQQTAMQTLEQSLAQRGITDSGVAAAALTQMEQEGTVNRAQIRAQAPGVVADEQSRFLQIGLGQNPGASMSAMLSQQAQQAGTAARQAQQAFGQSVQSTVQTATTALQDYFRPQQAPVNMYYQAPMTPTAPTNASIYSPNMGVA